MEASVDRTISATPPEDAEDSTGEALAALADEADSDPTVVTSAAQRAREELASEVEDSDDKDSLLDTICEIFGTDKENFKVDHPILFSLFKIISGEDSEDDEDAESEVASSNGINVVNTNPYRLQAADLEGYSSEEANHLRTIALAGIPPRNANALYQSEAASSVDRLTFLKYMAITVEACSHFEIAPDRMLPLIMATMKMESGFNVRSYNSSSGATGLMQHMPDFIPRRAQRLVESGAFASTPDKWDPRFQIFASVMYYVDGMKNISTYPPSTFGRDAYLIYNCGPGHYWLAEIGALDWDNDRLNELYNMPIAERVRRYGSNAGTFKDYAIRRLTRENTTFDRVQVNYTKYRNILYRGSTDTALVS